MTITPLPVPDAVAAELRRTAVRAAGRVAAREHLLIDRAAIGQLAEAVIDGISQSLLLTGFGLACERAEQYIADIDRYLVAPARRRAQAGQDTKGTLESHLQYLAGMQELHTSVQTALHRLTLSTVTVPRAQQPEPLTSHRPLPLLRETT